MTTAVSTPKAPATRPTTQTLSLKEAAGLMADYTALYKERADIMAAAKDKAAELTQELDKLTAAMHHWTDTNPSAFAGKKMLKTEFGEFGYRAGITKVKLPLNLDMSKYLETVRKVMPTAIEEEVNPRAIIQGWDHVTDLSKKLGKLGVELEQRDNFIITPKK